MKRRRTTATRLAVSVVTLAVAATACSGLGATTGSEEFSGKTLTVVGSWQGSEQKNFKKVLHAFSVKTGAKTKYLSSRAGGNDDFAAYIGDKVKRGKAPDVAMVPQVGVLEQFVEKKWLLPLPPKVELAAARNFALVWQNYGSVRRVLYGMYFKASNKSTVWYNPHLYKEAGVKPPKDYDEMMRVGKRLYDTTLPAFSVAAKDGWPLTDWFENIYLSQAGPANYAKLASNEIGWSDPTVIRALKTLAKFFKDKQLLQGGGPEALRTDLSESVGAVFGKEPKASMVYEGDFVGGLISGQFHKNVGKDAKVFPFPSVDEGDEPVIAGGDAAVAMKGGQNQDVAMSFIKYLTTAKAAAIWAKQGGYLSPNINLNLKAYRDDADRQIAKSLVEAGDSVQFDMSDQAPAAFGSTPGKGEWKILQEFVRDPSDPKATGQELDDAAAKAYLDAASPGYGG